jgi:hypothetical protein
MRAAPVRGMATALPALQPGWALQQAGFQQ